MNINYYKNKIKELTFKELLIKVNKKAIKKVCNAIIRFKHLRKDNRKLIDELKINYIYINLSKINLSSVNLKELKYLANKYINHEFDLLGSGYTKVNYNLDSIGVEGYKYKSNIHINDFDIEGNWLNNILPKSYIKFSKKLWKMVSQDYKPIDWQLDFKSGYRYNSKSWYKDQQIGKKPGVDIKVPWELARMQYLPQMAVAAKVLKEDRDKIITEFKNQVLDFLTVNPPSIGCNWTCTMDVAIRISNILIAHDILKQLDIKNSLDDKFEKILYNAVYEHGNFIINNLEWNGDKSGNHYFSDISGLLFAASYLNRTETTDAWLAFAVQETIYCIKTQFYNDGSNFEASTSYHRLSGELALYDTALIYGILNTDKVNALKDYNPNLIKRLKSLKKQEYNLDDKKFFPDWYIERLFKCGCFTLDLMKNNNHIPQVGDNDSGMFFKFSSIGSFISYGEAYNKYYNLKNNKEMMDKPNYEYWDEDVLDHSSFVSVVSGLFDCESFEEYSNKYTIDKSIVESLSKGIKYSREKKDNNIAIGYENIRELDYNITSEIIFKDYGVDNIDVTSIKLLPYSDFGIYIFKSPRFFMSVFAGENGQNGNGGHSHNDKLSFELNIHGKDIFVDPGTYLYTPLPERRNKFRSVKAHNVPIVKNKEQNEFITLFSMKNETKCKVLEYSNNSIKLYLNYRDIIITRKFNIYSDKIIIQDSCNKEFKVNFNRGEFFSNGYGKLIANSVRRSLPS